MFGLLNVHKPPGVTSRDVVDLVQRRFRREKVGHAGTLDPLATGVLVVCVGAATRLVEDVQKLPKRYAATFLLGRSSDTDDAEGEAIERPELPAPSRERLEAELPQFVGRIQQVPPIYSAIKQDGRRAYAMARRGETVRLDARPIDVYSLQIRRYEFPTLELEIACGSGCYVRSLGRDLAAAAGSAALMSALVRTAVGPFTLETAIDLTGLDSAALAARLIPPLAALPDLPLRRCSDDEIARLRNGMSIERTETALAAAAVNEAGELVATLVVDRAGGWRPDRNFLP